jgi:hypothetical protein
MFFVLALVYFSKYLRLNAKHGSMLQSVLQRPYLIFSTKLHLTVHISILESSVSYLLL